MHERDRQEELAQLKINASLARGEHRSMIMIAATTSSLVFASLPLAIFSDAPISLKITITTASLIGSVFSIRETESTRAEVLETQRRIEDYQAQN